MAINRNSGVSYVHLTSERRLTFTRRFLLKCSGRKVLSWKECCSHQLLHDQILNGSKTITTTMMPFALKEIAGVYLSLFHEIFHQITNRFVSQSTCKLQEVLSVGLTVWLLKRVSLICHVGSVKTWTAISTFTMYHPQDYGNHFTNQPYRIWIQCTLLVKPKPNNLSYGPRIRVCTFSMSMQDGNLSMVCRTFPTPATTPKLSLLRLHRLMSSHRNRANAGLKCIRTLSS